MKHIRHIFLALCALFCGKISAAGAPPPNIKDIGEATNRAAEFPQRAHEQDFCGQDVVRLAGDHDSPDGGLCGASEQADGCGSGADGKQSRKHTSDYGGKIEHDGCNDITWRTDSVLLSLGG